MLVLADGEMADAGGSMEHDKLGYLNPGQKHGRLTGVRAVVWVKRAACSGVRGKTVG